ncbi:hypothetical protein [Nocardioides sp. T2.26MG-1]|uniref:hypothetical protein n=1 Tax=Nocardioides sp. T2.26MG-1 TaxID=3041166 RepID=UPI00247789BB|nr:hypothetical protein [Nocardioides sp. T2.26MG-1]CAI9417392.1 hypothetical protein HIDPHFAB_03008 [Nocardioides sp. T2.26MG-1]
MPIIVDLAAEPGTGLDLTAIWLNTATDLSDVRSFRKVGGPLSANTKARVDIRQLANRVRLIRQGSVTGAVDLAESQSVPLVHLDRDDVAWLRARTGVLMCFRDHVGTKFYGAWSETPREVQPQFRDWIDVKLSVDQVTHPEAV